LSVTLESASIHPHCFDARITGKMVYCTVQVYEMISCYSFGVKWLVVKKVQWLILL